MRLSSKARNVTAPKLRITDMFTDTFLSLSSQGWRAALTMLGTVLGVTALVATVGFSRSAATEIRGHFDALRATEVTVRAADAVSQGAVVFPQDLQERLRQIKGVTSSGMVAHISGSENIARAWEVAQEPSSGTFLAVSASVFETASAQLESGRFFDEGHEVRSERVAVVGAHLARDVGLGPVEDGPALFIDGESFTVLGVVGEGGRVPELADSIAIPHSTAQQVFASRLEEPEVLIATELGAAETVASQAPMALRPDSPSSLTATTLPTPTVTRDAVAQETHVLFLALGGVALVIGALGIANVTLVSVLERVPEIGLRRALGAGTREIAVKFLSESTILGFGGGYFGSTLGVTLVATIALTRGWVAVIDPAVVFGGPLVGAASGLLAGVYPAWRAAKVEPIRALRRGLA